MDEGEREFNSKWAERSSHFCLSVCVSVCLSLCLCSQCLASAELSAGVKAATASLDLRLMEIDYTRADGADRLPVILP